jgi:hypothetical protein
LIPFMIIAGVLCIVLLILILPVIVEILVSSQNKWEFKLRILYFGRLPVWQWQSDHIVHSNRVKESLSGRADDTGIGQFIDIIKVDGLFSQIQLLIGRIWGRIVFRYIECDGRISLGDDYYTGMLIGMTVPLTLLINTRERANIQLMPLFEEEIILEGCLRGSFEVRPILVIMPILFFVLSSPFRQARTLLLEQ